MPAKPWECTIVCSDRHKPRLVEVLVEINEGAITTSRYPRVAADGRIAKRSDGDKLQVLPSTLMCPICHLALSLNLDKYGGRLRDAGVAQVELRDLITIITKQ